MDKKKAVALEYSKEQHSGAPKIVAVGEGQVAEKIVELAREYGVPVVEDQEVVGKLVKFPLGSEVPPQLYQAIAGILAFVYSLEKKEKSRKERAI